MKSSVTVAVTTPSTTHMKKLDRVNATARGRTKSSKMMPAHASRSHAAPSTPISSISVTAIARPSCTHSMEPIAMKAPVRAWFVITPALNGRRTVHVHVISLDIPFMIHEQLLVSTRACNCCRVSKIVAILTPNGESSRMRQSW